MKKKINKKLKIAICVNGRPHEGGITTSVNEYSNALRKLGHKVDVITIFGRSSYREIKPNLVKIGNKLLKNRPILTLITYFLSKVILSFHLYLNFFIKKYDIIFAMDFSVMNIFYPLKKLFKTPVSLAYFGGVEELIDQAKLKPKGWITNCLFNEQKKSFTKPDVIITSEALVPNIKKYRDIKTAPIHLIRSAVNPDKFFVDNKKREAFRQKLNIAPDKFVLLFAGRLDPRKGVIYPLLALNKLIKQRYKNFILLYAGEGQENESLEKYISQNKLLNYVKLLGSVNHQDMIDLYRAADCFLFTSIKQHGVRESISITILESITSGTPVIAFHSPDYKDDNIFLVDKRNCLLVPEKDVDGLVQAILTLSRNPEFGKKLNKQGQKDILDGGWTPKQIVKDILAQFNKA